MGNFKNLYNHYDEIATSNIMSYRLTASRAAQALVEKGDKKRALEVLDLASSEIPFEKYNDPRSVDDMVYSYLLAGNEKKHWHWQQKFRVIRCRIIITTKAWIRNTRKQ